MKEDNRLYAMKFDPNKIEDIRDKFINPIDCKINLNKFQPFSCVVRGKEYHFSTYQTMITFKDIMCLDK